MRPEDEEELDFGEGEDAAPGQQDHERMDRSRTATPVSPRLGAGGIMAVDGVQGRSRQGSGAERAAAGAGSTGGRQGQVGRRNGALAAGGQPRRYDYNPPGRASPPPGSPQIRQLREAQVAREVAERQKAEIQAQLEAVQRQMAAQEARPITTEAGSSKGEREASFAFARLGAGGGAGRGGFGGGPGRGFGGGAGRGAAQGGRGVAQGGHGVDLSGPIFGSTMFRLGCARVAYERANTPGSREPLAPWGALDECLVDVVSDFAREHGFADLDGSVRSRLTRTAHAWDLYAVMRKVAREAAQDNGHIGDVWLGECWHQQGGNPGKRPRTEVSGLRHASSTGTLLQDPELGDGSDLEGGEVDPAWEDPPPLEPNPLAQRRVTTGEQRIAVAGVAGSVGLVRSDMAVLERLVESAVGRKLRHLEREGRPRRTPTPPVPEPTEAEKLAKAWADMAGLRAQVRHTENLLNMEKQALVQIATGARETRQELVETQRTLHETLSWGLAQQVEAVKMATQAIVDGQHIRSLRAELRVLGGVDRFGLKVPAINWKAASDTISALQHTSVGKLFEKELGAKHAAFAKELQGYALEAAARAAKARESVEAEGRRVERMLREAADAALREPRLAMVHEAGGGPSNAVPGAGQEGDGAQLAAAGDSAPAPAIGIGGDGSDLASLPGLVDDASSDSGSESDSDSGSESGSESGEEMGSELEGGEEQAEQQPAAALHANPDTNTSIATAPGAAGDGRRGGR